MSQKTDQKTYIQEKHLWFEALEFFEGGLALFDEKGICLEENLYVQKIFDIYPHLKERVQKEVLFSLQEKKEKVWEDGLFLGKTIFREERVFLFLKKKPFLGEEFCSFLVHELKNPLTVIQGYAELLQGDGEKETVIKGNKIFFAAKKMEKMLRKLKALVFLEKIEKKKFSLQEVLKKSVEELAFLYPLHKVEIEGNSDFLVEGDSDLFFHLVSNLVENGMKYSSEMTPVVISYQEKEDGWELRIQDRGCGMREEHVGSIFHKFFQVDSSQNGSGIGLFLVHKIMERCGGKISVHSKEKEGSSFSLFFQRNP